MSNSKMKANLSYVIASVHKQLEDELHERLRPAGIPIEQLRILEALHAADGRPMNELAALALIEPTTLTKVIDRMVAEQLVFRTQDLEDRRRILIMLAPAGRILFRRLNRITASQQQRIAKHMPPGKLEELHSLLRSLVEQ